jgi:DNA polymerase-3 subunit epsilon
MTRYIVLDTETTGLKHEEGHRIIEIAGIELIDGKLTGKSYETRLQPDRQIDPEAKNVHGISDEDLKHAPRFSNECDNFIDFVRGSTLIIHNASFDVGFINSELEKVSKGRIEDYCPDVVDTLLMAREIHPGQRSTLDALCDRYHIDRSARVKHGALVDVEILAEVYVAMSPIYDFVKKIRIRKDHSISATKQSGYGRISASGRTGVVIRPDADELEEHLSFIEKLDKFSKGNCLWKSQADEAGYTKMPSP